MKVVNVKLFNVLGKQVYNNTMNTNRKVYLPVLSKGIYFYNVISDKENSTGQLMVIE